MSNPFSDLINNLIKLVSDIVHHNGSHAIVNDVAVSVSDVAIIVPEAMADKHQVIADAVNAAIGVAAAQVAPAQPVVTPTAS